MDEDILKDEWLGCHPCINTSSLRIRVADIFGPIREAMGHEMRTVALPCEE